MALNLIDPYFFVRIAGQDGTIRVFAASGGDDSEKPNEGRFLQQLTITEQIGGTSTMQAVLSPPRDLGLKLLNDPLLSMGSAMEVSWGYPSFGELRRAFGVLTVPDVTIGQEITITVNAEGFLFGLIRTERNKVWRETPADETSAALSPQEIVTEIAEGFGFGTDDLEFDFDDGRFEEQRQDKEGNPQPFQQYESDWLFIRRLAKEHNATAHLQGGTKLRIIGNEVPFGKVVATFRMYGQLNTPENIYPLLGFQVDQGGVVVGLAGRGVQVRDVDPDEGPDGTIGDGDQPGIAQQNDTTSTTPSATSTPAGGSPTDSVPSAFSALAHLVDKAHSVDENETGKQLAISARKSNLSLVAQAHFDGARLRTFEADAQAIGVPGIFPT